IPATPVGPFGAGDPGSAKETPFAVSLSDRIELGHFRDAYALAGVELGITDAIGLPSFRGVLAIGWAPRDHDMDGDGVPADVDQCPDQPEDKDGHDDDDGCPDPDDDGDGIGDAQDACPKEAGDPSTDPHMNGCPNPDRDGDTFDNAADKCPDEPETFNGV